MVDYNCHTLDESVNSENVSAQNDLSGKKEQKNEESPNQFNFEVTKHTLHFHEDASIYSLTNNKNHLITAGTDQNVRFWHVNLHGKKNENILCSPETTSVKIDYCNNIEMNHSVNVVKAYGEYVVFGSIAGEISGLKESNCYFESSIARGIDGDAVNDICFVSKNVFACCFDSGKLLLYEIIENPKYVREDLKSPEPVQIVEKQNSLDRNIDTAKDENQPTKKRKITMTKIEKPLNFKLLHSLRPHFQSIQGLSFNVQRSILVTFSNDKSVKYFYVSKKLTYLVRMPRIFADEQELIIFRKFGFSSDGDFLFLGGCNGKLLNILHYPFAKDCILGQLGPFDQHVSRIIEFGSRNVVLPATNQQVDSQRLGEIKSEWEKLHGKENEKDKNEEKPATDPQQKDFDENTQEMEVQDCEKEENLTENESFQEETNESLQEITPQKSEQSFMESGTVLTNLLEREIANVNLSDELSQTLLNSPFTPEAKSQKEIVVCSSSEKLEDPNNLIFFAVRNSVYCMNRKEIICKFENVSFKGITDLNVYKDVVFISSVDGLISSIRFLN